MRSEVPAELAAVAAKMIAKKPEDRYQTPIEVAQVLRSLIQTASEGASPALSARPPAVAGPGTKEAAKSEAKAHDGALAGRPETLVEGPSTMGEGPKSPATKTARPASAKSAANRKILYVAGAIAALAALMVAATIVVRITTDKGELIVETDNPNIELIVTQGGKQVTIVDGQTKQQIKLSSGAYEIELAKGGPGLQLSTNQFTLSRGGREIVRVRREVTRPLSNPLPSNSTSVSVAKDVVKTQTEMIDRRAADAVLSLGGSVTIHVNGRDQGIEPGKALPTGPFQLIHVGLNDKPELADADLNTLEGLTHLSSLNLVNCSRITDAGLAHLERLTLLKFLSIAGTHITDAGLVHLRGLTRLEALRISRTRVADAGLVNLHGLTKLRSLLLFGTQVTDAGLEHLKNLSELDELMLGGDQVTDIGLAQLGNLSRLRMLSLSNTRITDTGLVHLERLTDLRELNLSATQVTNAGLAHLQHLQKLEKLYLTGTQVTSAGLVHLRGLTDLKELHLERTKVTAVGAEELRKSLPACRIIGAVDLPVVLAPPAEAKKRPVDSFPDRFPIQPRGPGKISVKADTLVLDDVHHLEACANVYFGDTNWVDYDFQVDVKRLAGFGHCALWFRHLDLGNQWFYSFGKGGHLVTLENLHDARLRGGSQHDVEPIRTNRWYTLKVSVRGAEFRCFVDGRPTFSETRQDHPRGCVGFHVNSSQFAFRNIKVTAPDGTVLLEGLPAADKLRYRIDGAIEGEKLKVLNKSSGFPLDPQDMTSFLDGQWSGDSQLYGKPPSAGAWADLELPVPADGQYHVVVFLTRARDYGIIQFSVNGAKLGKPIDCFHGPTVLSTGAIDVGTVLLKKGTATLRVEVVGTNNKSVGLRYMWGLDCVVLKLAPQDKTTTPVHQASDVQGFVPLFNGKDITGWKTHPAQPGNWHVENGILICSSGGTSHLYTERGDYKDFHLRAEARVNRGGNGGIRFRTKYGPTDPPGNPKNVLGYIAKLNDSWLGSLDIWPKSTHVRTRESKVPPGDWLILEVIAHENHIIIKINEETTVDFTDDERRFGQGHLALQHYDPGTVIEFRKIEIKELSPADP